MKSVLVSGYYGFGNLGDEAVLAGMLSTFRELCPDVTLTVLSARPEETEAALQVKAIPRANPFAILRAIRDSDLFISGGGGLLQDRTSQKSLLYYLGLLYLAQRRGCKTMIMAQGIGPLLRASSRWLARKVVENTDAISVRDEQSASLLREIAPNSPPIEVTADLAFAHPTFLAVRTPHSALRTPHSLAVSLRPWRGEERWLPEVSSALNLLSCEDSLRPLLIPLHCPHDRQLLDLLLPNAAQSGARAANRFDNASMNVPRGTLLVSPLAETAEVADNLNVPDQALQAIGQTQILLGMRLHSLIFAAMMGVPFVALAYDPKVQALANDAAMPCFPLAKARAEDIVSAVRTLWAKRQEEGERLLAWAQQQRNKARRNVELALDLLTG